MENRKLKKLSVDMKIFSKKLCLEIDCDTNNESILIDYIAQAITSGFKLIHLGSGNSTDSDFLKIAKKIKQICDEFDTTLIIKSRADIAYLISADGVILEQDDIDIGSAREILGEERIIGIYISNYDEFSVKDGADYISIKQICSTPTEPVKTGIEYAKWVSENTYNKVPIFGNKDYKNLLELIKDKPHGFITNN